MRANGAHGRRTAGSRYRNLGRLARARGGYRVRVGAAVILGRTVHTVDDDRLAGSQHRGWIDGIERAAAAFCEADSDQILVATVLNRGSDADGLTKVEAGLTGRENAFLGDANLRTGDSQALIASRRRAQGFATGRIGRAPRPVSRVGNRITGISVGRCHALSPLVDRVSIW